MSNRVAKQNTGQVCREKEILKYLRNKAKIEFTDDEVRRTMTHLQIQTSLSDSDNDALTKLVKPVGGIVRSHENVLWIYIEHVQSWPLYVIGIMRMIMGASLIIFFHNGGSMIEL